MTVIIGTGLNDTLTGSDENDSIFGRAGDDTLSGLEGKDALFGEAGNDTLNGNDGDDFLDGGDDIDRREHLTLAEILDKWMTINNYTAFNGGYLLESRDIFKRLCNYFCLCA